MTLGIYPVFDKRFEGHFDSRHGEVLLNENVALEELARARGLRTLESFHAYAHVEIPDDYTGDPDELYVRHTPAWYNPVDGIQTIEALIRVIGDRSVQFMNERRASVVAALEGLKEALRASDRAEAKFNLLVFEQ